MRQMLEEAGGDIRDKTNGLVEFRVQVLADGDTFYYDCYLTVPRAGFQHLLLRVVTSARPFPARVTWSHRPDVVGITDEGVLRSVLQRYFQSQEVREVVEGLLATFAHPEVS